MPIVRKKVRRRSWRDLLRKNFLIGTGIALFFLLLAYLLAGQLGSFWGQVGQFGWRVARHVHSAVIHRLAKTRTPVASGPLTVAAVPRTPDPVVQLLNQSLALMEQRQPDAALEKVSEAIKLAPQNMEAYGLRGNIYTEKKQWDLAEQDYQMVLRLDGANVQVKFNFAEIKFMQKKYDEARPGFTALAQDPNIGDLAAYKVFLCDLLAGHEDVAARELNVFNEAGINPSYYFSNAAWSIYHHKPEEARSWLRSAAGIYTSSKYKLYSTSLMDIGYLPLPPHQI